MHSKICLALLTSLDPDAPLEGQPSAQCWKLWQSALGKCLLRISPNPSLVLSKPLGSWIQSPPQWRWWFSPGEERLYSVTSSATMYYAPVARNYHTRTRHYGLQTSATLPADALPTTVIDRPDHTLCIEGHSPVQDPADEADPGVPWWGHPFHSEGNFEDLVLDIQQGTVVAITDGSFKEAFGTAAYVIQDSLDNPKCRFILVNQTPGRSDAHSPYMAEVGGILGMPNILQ
jgi:hypothetical protein